MIDGEEKIVKRAIVGESSAFGLLYDEYQPRIYRFILVKVSHREEAEDLTHQVFLKAWQNIGNFRFRGIPFSGWLYQIARNQVIDHYRTKRTHVSLDVLLDGDHRLERGTASGKGAHADEISSDGRLDIALESTLSMEQIRKVMAQLTDDQQDVLLMRFVDDLSIRDVAKALVKSDGAVKLLQHRAIEKLKELLHDN
ncbi:MAG: sigma-70 family RNA polymerase sigma factor [bacterium]|nr:sigma-70 family RNA polymerase sigma factor [bacterium]